MRCLLKEHNQQVRIITVVNKQFPKGCINIESMVHRDHKVFV